MKWFNEVRLQIIKNLGLQVSTLSVVTLSFFVTFSLYTVFKNLDHIFSGWSNHLQMSIYLDSSLSEKDLDRLKEQVSGMKEVESVKFVSKEEYKQNFTEKLSQVLPELNDLNKMDNPFEDGLEVELIQHQNIAGLSGWMETISNTILAINGVKNVTYGKVWMKEYSQMVLAIKSSATVIILIILVSSLFVVANAIKTLVVSNRKEIELMEIIGATPSMIRKPYLLNGGLIGFLAFMGALLFTYMLYEFCLELFRHHIVSLNMKVVFPSFTEILVFGTVTVLVCVLGSYSHIRRLNTGWLASQS